MAEHKMVIVDGVRYRPEDAPAKASESEHKMRTPAKTARTGKQPERVERDESGE